MTDKQTCEDRLPDHLAGRLEDMRSMVGWSDAWSRTRNDDRYEQAERRMQEYPLAVDIQRTYTLRLELSTGGPADFITAEIDGGELRDVRYHFQDWFDGASQLLTGDERETVAAYVRRLVDLDSPEVYAAD